MGGVAICAPCALQLEDSVRRLTTEVEMAFVNVFDTGHIAPTVHSAQIWGDFVHQNEHSTMFDQKLAAYDKTLGQTNVIRSEKPQFVKARLNYRKHDLPHTFNPVTDNFVTSFTGFPLPERGPDSADMTGKPRPYGHGACDPGASAINPRHSRDVPHGMYHTVDILTGKPQPIHAARCGRRSADPELSSAPPLYPKRYVKKGATMQWRSYAGASGRNNINKSGMSTTYGETYGDPWCGAQPRRRPRVGHGWRSLINN